MKIGILTFHNAINYGAVIQCYALMTYLQSRGHSVGIIDYRLPSIENYKKFISKEQLSLLKGFPRKMKYLLGSVFLWKKKKKTANAFDLFLKTRLHLSPRVLSDKMISNQYDYIIFGSDQIWNLKITNGFNPFFWGQFTKGKTKFVTYAASMGEIEHLSNEQWEGVYKRIASFDYISVRENALKDCLEKKISKEIQCTIDPTLLVEPGVLDSIAVCPQEHNYIFLYNVTKDSHAEEFVIRLASTLNCNVVIATPKPRFRVCFYDSKKRFLDGISPEQFLGYIKNARVVVGNSFHVIALSIAFNKVFYSLDSHRPERIKSLLKYLGIFDRHISTKERIQTVLDVDYSSIKERLEVLRKKSILFLENAGL